MILARTRAEVKEWSAAREAEGNHTVLVPTMGSLHEGHLSLVRIGADRGATGVSIFVNPLQFGPSEDFHLYPRDLDADVKRAESADKFL